MGWQLVDEFDFANWRREQCKKSKYMRLPIMVKKDPVGNGQEGSYKSRWGESHKLCLGSRTWTSKNKVKRVLNAAGMESRRGQRNVIGFGDTEIIGD